MASNKALIFETLDSTIGFSNTYPPDSDLSSGQCNPLFEQLGSAQNVTNVGYST